MSAEPASSKPTENRERDSAVCEVTDDAPGFCERNCGKECFADWFVRTMEAHPNDSHEYEAF